MRQYFRDRSFTGSPYVGGNLLAHNNYNSHFLSPVSHSPYFPPPGHPETIPLIFNMKGLKGHFQFPEKSVALVLARNHTSQEVLSCFLFFIFERGSFCSHFFHF